MHIADGQWLGWCEGGDINGRRGVRDGIDVDFGWKGAGIGDRA